VLTVFALSSPAHSGTLSARTIAGGRIVGNIVGNIEERAGRALFAWCLGQWQSSSKITA
jgi:hypothetical protein